MRAVFEKVIKINLHRKSDKLTSEHLQLRALQHQLQLVLLGLKYMMWVKHIILCFRIKLYKGLE